MGTTLENGVYLPSEGERNCYAGLKTNWEILDQKVADVTALQQAVAGALHREIVESLPTTDIDPNTIYMVLSGTSATENVYNEFMYVNNAWELIGTSATDLTNYYTKGDVDGLLILKANASDLTSHTGDATIHVTTADKSKWNNGVSQAYVFRYSSTALVASSTNSNTLLDNTDNLKVGDKVIDSDGVLFSITAIDTANSTFTVGSALVDLALDGNVVHTSGDETVGGSKTFSNDLIVANTDTTANTPNLNLRNYNADRGTTETSVQTIMFSDKNAKALTLLESRRVSNGNTATNILCYNTDANNNTVSGGVAIIKSKTETNFAPNANNAVTCGRPLAKWSDVQTYQINGLTPSSLSLPSDRSARVDISSYITNLGNGDNNQYIVPANGYIWLHFTSINSALCYSQTSGGLTNYAQTFVRYQGDGQLYAFFPVRKDDYFIVQIYTSSTAVVQNAYFIPCQGNV